MSTDEITHIRIGKLVVGITGLSQVLKDVSTSYSDKPDDFIQSELLNRLITKNYIPDSAREVYALAFFREYKRFLGQKVEEEIPDELEIKVLGTGCAAFERLTDQIREIIEEKGYLCTFEEVLDWHEINKIGGTPVLFINNKIKSIGKTLSRNKIIAMIEEAFKQPL